jgi:sarcosine oxidase
MTNKTYDTIVVGLGAMGSASTYHLAKRGYKVLGLDAHPHGHNFGSSHGYSRIIRKAYYEAASYVPLVLKAYELWHTLEQESGKSLLRITGGISFDHADGKMLQSKIASAKMYDLKHEILTPTEAKKRFPGLHLAEDHIGVYEPDAGMLQPEECIKAHLEVAARHGAEVHFEENVVSWQVDGAGVRVQTNHAVYLADRLILSVGPWASELLGELKLPLSVRRIVNAHFEPDNPTLFHADHFPIYIFSTPGGASYYGMPYLPGQGVKIGRHDNGEECTPRTIRRTVDPAEVEALRTIINRYMPGAGGELKWSLTCMYTNTPDNNFVLDKHPHHAQVALFTGCSGHGYKFASVIGEILTDLTMNGQTAHQIGFLSAKRFF